MRDKYGVARGRYCYPGTDILVNLLNIRNASELAEAEAVFTAERYRTYNSSNHSLEQFSVSHLKFLHHHLFQDIYDWAGEIRDVDISKGNTRFCTCSRILPEANKLFKRIPTLADSDNHEVLVELVADLFCEMNWLHPFREGNGRTQRFFFEEMLFTLGYEVIWPSISQEEWVNANIAGVNLDLSLLIKIFSKAINPHFDS